MYLYVCMYIWVPSSSLSWGIQIPLSFLYSYIISFTMSVCVTRKLEHMQTSTGNFHGSLGGRLTLKQATSNF